MIDSITAAVHAEDRMGGLAALKGERVRNARFLGDAVEFTFGDATLLAFLPLCVRSGVLATYFPASGTLPRLTSLIGCQVVAVEFAPDVSLRIFLSEGQTIGVPLSNRRGRPAIHFRPAPGRPVQVL